MITYIQGDIFTSPATVLVNTVNTVGVMGKGIARDFKTYFPEMFRKYQEACESGELRIGTLQFFRTPHKSVLNFPTKRHWREKSRVEDIERGLQTFVSRYKDFSISSIAFPQLGCGNGELDWEAQVQPLMERYLAPLPIDIYIHLYDAGSGFIEHRESIEMKRWLQSEPESLPFTAFREDIEELLEHDAEAGQWSIVRLDAVVADDDGEALVYVDGEERHEILMSALKHLWQQLRSFGLVAGEDVGILSPHVSTALFTFLSRVSYIKPVTFLTLRRVDPDNDPGGVREFGRGIRLMPRTEPANASQQLELVGLP